MQLDLGDVPAWAALLISAGAVYVATRANRHARDSAAASKDSAGSARRSADAAERQAVAAEAAIPPPPPQVVWQVERVNNKRYLLRNVGVGTATGVQIDVRQAHPLVGLNLGNGTVGPNESVSFLITGSMGRPSPTELWVSWDGQDEPVAVPV
ncbi:hypothetical protein AB0L34_12235 [Micromonospora sp. NPDC052213]|uniref:hypothetical protein n=1 Tax=Micromonospora sp. NPDC052213 TaxID=3155812 RepID=UPI00341D3063